MEAGPFIVRAVYGFKGTNNDELCFSKNDVITVTQKEEGGWWEGTLNDKTGWFPSNYVTEHSLPTANGDVAEGADVPEMTQEQCQKQQEYRSQVLKDIIESEKTHLADLKNLNTKHLQPLKKSDILSNNEIQQLVGNLDEVIEVYGRLLRCLEEQKESDIAQQKVGSTFLNCAPTIQATLLRYCSSHPTAVCILEKHKEELNAFMESEGASKPGLLVLTTGLSAPFRRLERYPGMLQEYQRHLEDANPDRGDTQRSMHLYREITSKCSATRRQKELELEVVTGEVHGWSQGRLGVLGELLHLGSVALLPDARDRHLALFPSTLVMLSVSPRMSAFIFEGQYSLSGLQVNPLENSDQHKNSFEITSSGGNDRLVAVCQTIEDQRQWVDLLRQHSRAPIKTTTNPSPPSSSSSPAPPRPPHNSRLGTRQVNSSPFSSHLRGVASTAAPVNRPKAKVWSMSCLLPSPPMRPCPPPTVPSSKEDRKQNSKKKEEKWREDDALVLRVIEAYCSSAKTRYTVSSIDLGGKRGVNTSPAAARRSAAGAACWRSSPSSVDPTRRSFESSRCVNDSLSPFGDLRVGASKGQSSSWCCGLAAKAISKANIEFDC